MEVQSPWSTSNDIGDEQVQEDDTAKLIVWRYECWGIEANDIISWESETLQHLSWHNFS